MKYIEKLEQLLSEGDHGNPECIIELQGERSIPKIELRTLFDSGSSEWSNTTLDEKVKALKMISDKKIPLEMIMMGYKNLYKDRQDILDELPESLATIIQYMNGFKSSFA